MSEKQELRKRLKKEYQRYILVKHNVESGGWYGDWYHQFKQMEEQTLQGFKSIVDGIMAKLGYEKWTDYDVMAELVNLQESEK